MTSRVERACSSGDREGEIEERLQEPNPFEAVLRRAKASALPDAPTFAPLPAAMTGELIALTEPGRAPLVRYAGQPGFAAVCARTTVSLGAADIGQPVVLVFEGGSPERPIVIGVIRDEPGWPLEEPPAHVQVDADGQRMVVTAKVELVLRCGKASVTLTEDGKVMIEGSSILSRATGSHRIKGGSVQIN